MSCEKAFLESFSYVEDQIMDMREQKNCKSSANFYSQGFIHALALMASSLYKEHCLSSAELLEIESICENLNKQRKICGWSM